jgi:hypothetical protein
MTRLQPDDIGYIAARLSTYEQKMSARLLHDPMQLGVATMGLEACKMILEKNPGAIPGPEMDDDGRKETG